MSSQLYCESSMLVCAIYSLLKGLLMSPCFRGHSKTKKGRRFLSYNLLKKCVIGFHGRVD
ncbi:hypothetical protein CH380_00060 [Leptospira adleri]|uniref:Uncharacterized protein n=1 Tax=Leptospira adleri TaxID=2023186 RepID=A0A2M9YTU0_9LEPT|nr:hypothetical protein CH380_00060 [Leptospira adleri]PJZ60657.1 hypothetical protein CH376_17310 [Leptospira adleri]